MTRLKIAIPLGLLLLALAAWGVAAQTSGSFQLYWATFTNGSQASSSGSFNLEESTGNSVADAGAASSPSFTLTNGYATGERFNGLDNEIYIPLVNR